MTFPLYSKSLATVESEVIIDPALVVGIPRAWIASDHKYSLMELLRTALPSAVRE